MSDNSKIKMPREFWWALVLIILSWFSYYFIFTEWFEIKPNEYGDALGALNTLFTGLTLLFVIYAVIIQSREFTTMNNAFKEQNKTQEIQRFENTFFKLLDLYSKNLSAISYNQCDREWYGKLAFGYHFNDLKGRYSSALCEKVVLNKNDVIHIYNEFYNDNYNIIFHYFINLYRIFVYLDESNISENEKNNYSKILRSQLSSDELRILFFNCLDDKGKGANFRKYIEKYSLFNNLDLTFLDNKPLENKLIDSYPENSFKLNS